MGMVFCRGCGKEIHETAVSCPQCGATQGAKSLTQKRILPAVILPSMDGHPVKRVKFATEVNHEQAERNGQVTEALFAAV